jgi:aspartate aminotransferase
MKNGGQCRLVMLSDRVAGLHVSPIRRVAALLAEANSRKELISFGGGAPSLPPPKEVSDEIIKMVSEDSQSATVYSGTKGYLDLRRLVSDDWAKRQGEVYAPETEITLTDGATEAIYAAFQSLLNKNDEVVLTDPSYLGYLEAAQLAGGRVRRLPVSVEAKYQPDLEMTKSLISRRTKAVLLLSPDNPTGRIVESSFVKGLLDLAVDNDFWILYDATYRDIVYGERGQVQPRLTSFPGAHERVIAIGSFSKEASVPGLRLGYALGPQDAIDAMEKVKQYTSLAPNTLSQRAMLRFLTGDIKEKYLREIVIPTYVSRRDFMTQAIAKYLPDASTVTPDGAFYFFVDMRKYLATMQITDEQFCNHLTKQKGVITIPGSFFGEKGVGHIRLTFVSEPEERIDVGMRRMGEYTFSFAFSMVR